MTERPGAAGGDGGRRREVPLVPGTPVDGRYRVVAPLGEWRIGTAYSATAAADGGQRTLIVLRLRPGQAADFAEWVRAEVGRVRPHLGPGFLAPRDGGLAGGGCGYVALDPWAARSLLQTVKSDGRMGAERAVAVVERLARTVARLHAAGLLLGDLRPSTVLLPDDGSEAPLILDLGVARGLAERLETPPAPSASYCAPARLAGDPPTVADDVFALGAVLYFLITGRGPSPRVRRDGEDAPERRVATPPSWVARDEGLARYVDPLALRALAPAPEARFPGAAAMADALRALGEVFRLSPAAREVLGLGDPEAAGFRREPTSPFLLHDVLGLPPPFPRR